jgi:hypothetical protein
MEERSGPRDGGQGEGAAWGDGCSISRRSWGAIPASRLAATMRTM